LRSDSYQSIDVLANWHQHLSRHVATLLGSRHLIFNVNARGTVLDEHLCQFHDSCETTVAGVGICDDGSEKVSICNAATIGFGRGYPLFSLFAVVEELSHEQLMDFVWDGVL